MLLRILPWLGWGGMAAFVGLWLSARDAVIEERGACNAATLQTALDAALLQNKVLLENNETLLIESAEKQRQDDEAVRLARSNELTAKAEVEESRRRIDELIEEIDGDELPDSGECLSAFVLNDSVAGMRVQAASCHPFSAGGWSAGGADCFRAEGINGADSAGRDFATITYGDTLKLWAIDRGTIKTLNGRLAQIEELGNEAE